jgi:hypothetical protein
MERQYPDTDRGARGNVKRLTLNLPEIQDRERDHEEESHTDLTFGLRQYPDVPALSTSKG